MKKNAPEIIQLRLDIEQNVGRKMRTPYDFEFLTGAIWERLHENISPTTLKRLWGYIDGADTTRRTTLCILSSFLGCADWEDYLEHLALRSDIESSAFAVEGIHSADLQPGDRVEVMWQPNRRCVFRHEGNMHFVVEESVHAKLQVGDRFVCPFFLIGQPMYIDNLFQADNAASMSYVAGSKHGLSAVHLV